MNLTTVSAAEDLGLLSLFCFHQTEKMLDTSQWAKPMHDDHTINVNNSNSWNVMVVNMSQKYQKILCSQFSISQQMSGQKGPVDSCKDWVQRYT